MLENINKKVTNWHILSHLISEIIIYFEIVAMVALQAMSYNFAVS
jgi:hypothetical protein